jgi:SMC interacting uncharacterized protein involved in chromosome segregation
MAGATQVCEPVAHMSVTPMSTERERLVRDINNLKERVSLVWLDMISKRMTPAERQELLKSIESFLKKLDTLRAKLDQPPTDVA